MHEANIGVDVRYSQSVLAEIQQVCKINNQLLFWGSRTVFILYHSYFGGFIVVPPVFRLHTPLGYERGTSLKGSVIVIRLPFLRHREGVLLIESMNGCFVCVTDFTEIAALPLNPFIM